MRRGSIATADDADWETQPPLDRDRDQDAAPRRRRGRSTLAPAADRRSASSPRARNDRAIEPHDLAMVADIGGTNARFALTDDRAGRAAAVCTRRSLPCAGFASLQHAAEHFLDDRRRAKPERAAIAVASPGDGDEIRLTNRAWSFSRARIRRRAWASHALDVLNDFGAVAWAVPALDAGRCRDLARCA